MDNMDRRILQLIQDGLPLVPEPYRELAQALNTTEEEVLARLEKLCSLGVIRRLGAIFDSRRLGYRGTLCAMKVPHTRLGEVAEVVNAYPGVTHNYLREHDYNMWFTVLAPSRERLEEILSRIRDGTGIDDILTLPAERIFKIKVSFELPEV